MDKPVHDQTCSLPPEDVPAADATAADRLPELDADLFAAAARKVADKHTEAFRKLANQTLTDPPI